MFVTGKEYKFYFKENLKPRKQVATICLYHAYKGVYNYHNTSNKWSKHNTTKSSDHVDIWRLETWGGS